MSPMRIVEEATRIAREVASEHAADVDARARFPREAVEALREAGLLGSLVPRSLGGPEVPFAEVAAATEELARACASTAMVFAMHQIQVACLVRHGGTPCAQDLLRRIASDGQLLASATTEIGIGGDTRRSSCAVERDDGKVRLEKQAPVISYGNECDVILVTARAGADSPQNDQVLVIAERADTRLEQTTTWSGWGLRGTCSHGFRLEMSAPDDAVLDTPYAEISAQTMLPVSHLLWSSVWLGIATEAASKSRQFVRQAARKSPGSTPPGALRQAELDVELETMRHLVHGHVREFEGLTADSRDGLGSVRHVRAMNALKVATSTSVVDIVQRALLICGMAGYSAASPFSLDRSVRDSLAAQLMINNDRLLGTIADLGLMSRD